MKKNNLFLLTLILFISLSCSHFSTQAPKKEIKDMSYLEMKNGSKLYWKAEKVAEGVRIGNLVGSFGSGAVHGELPGETIYELK